uniref:Secreted protein n=1 Tax=Cacopsylla melanoneura TaxID=428564 RepID=A0A8D8ZGQ0_9HEMI
MVSLVTDTRPLLSVFILVLVETTVECEEVVVPSLSSAPILTSAWLSHNDFNDTGAEGLLVSSVLGSSGSGNSGSSSRIKLRLNLTLGTSRRSSGVTAASRALFSCFSTRSFS